MSRRILALIASAAFVVLGACTHKADRPPLGQDPTSVQPGGAGVSGGGGSDAAVDGGTTDADTDAGVCTDLTITGNLVDEQGTLGDPPLGTGGTIEDGTYDLVEAHVYVSTAGPTGISYRSSLRITGAVLERALFVQTASGPQTVSDQESLTVVGANLTLAETCPRVLAPVVYTYTFAAGQLTITNPSAKQSLLFQKK